MREALTRRFQRYADSLANPIDAPGQQNKDETWRLLPDLLIVDGGKGQLGVAVEVLKAFHLFEQVPVVGLAKQQEELFLPEHTHSILLPRRSQALFLVQRIRDEAHRFAITANRAKRASTGIVSQLETVPGIGPAKRKALLKAFDRDIDAIRAASIEDLMRVPGISRQLAEAIKAQL
jgi:excinuclease ABC subunit C